MPIGRRGFLGAIAAAVAGATLDPERALWVPGKRLISLPTAPRLEGMYVALYTRLTTPAGYEIEHPWDMIEIAGNGYQRMPLDKFGRAAFPEATAAWGTIVAGSLVRRYSDGSLSYDPPAALGSPAKILAGDRLILTVEA